MDILIKMQYFIAPFFLIKIHELPGKVISEFINIIRDFIRRNKTENFKQLFNERSVTYPLNKKVARVFLDIQFVDNMIRVDFSQGQLAGFISKLKGGSKKKLFMQILE